MPSSPNGRHVLCDISPNRLLMEIDRPFVGRNRSPIGAGDVEHAVKAVADLRGQTSIDIFRQILGNLRALIGRQESYLARRLIANN